MLIQVPWTLAALQTISIMLWTKGKKLPLPGSYPVPLTDTSQTKNHQPSYAQIQRFILR